MAKYTEKELIEGLTICDSKVVQYLLDKHSYSIIRHVKKNSGNLKDGKDILHEALMTVHKQLVEKKLVLKNCKLFTYIYKVCKNLWLKELSKKKKSKTVAIEEVGEVHATYEDGSELVSREEIKWYLYHKHFAELSVDCKKIIDMRNENTPYVEIIKVLGYNDAQQARKKRYRCVQQLTKLIENDQDFLKTIDDEI